MPARRPHLTPRALVRLLTCAGLVPTGCAKHAPNATPQATVAAYAQALAQGDAATVQALTAPPSRGYADDAQPGTAVETDRIAEALETYQAERQALSESLSSPVAAIDQIAWVTLLDGTEVIVERDESGWRVVSPSPLPYGQQTPRQALWSFVRALRHRRWEVLLRLMPDAARGDLTAEALGENLMAQRQEWERMLSLLETALDEPIEVVGERATMPYADGFAVHFLLEDGRWKIEDPE